MLTYRRRCPTCSELVKNTAARCPHCHAGLERRPVPAWLSAALVALGVWAVYALAT